MITVIGIGTEKDEWTQAAAHHIQQEQHAFVRTAKTAAGGAIVKRFPHVQPLDDLYEKAQNFDQWVSDVCDALRSADKAHGSAAYLTDGNGCDAVTEKLSERGDVAVLFGVSPHRARRPTQNALTLTATYATEKRPYLDTRLELHVTEIDDAHLAGDLKLWLMEYYDDEQPVTLCVRNTVLNAPLCDIDRQSGYNYACELFIDAQEGFVKKKYGFGDLLRIMEKLTAQDGCSWDKAQTHESIRVNMIEEAYEAVDAIDAGDLAAMEEELGDVILQAVFHCNMAHRLGEFETADVLTGLCRKLVGRHTHIFGNDKAQNADEALGFWEQAKSAEKHYVSTADQLNRLPEGFPALLAAQKTYKKLKKAGVAADLPAPSQTEIDAARNEKDFARLLFLLCARAAACGVDAEPALNKLVAQAKRDFAAAEQNGDTADFLQKLCK